MRYLHEARGEGELRAGTAGNTPRPSLALSRHRRTVRTVAGNLDYYSAAAQVLPLIFIGLAFEARYFTSRRTYDGTVDDRTRAVTWMRSGPLVLCGWQCC